MNFIIYDFNDFNKWYLAKQNKCWFNIRKLSWKFLEIDFVEHHLIWLAWNFGFWNKELLANLLSLIPLKLTPLKKRHVGMHAQKWKVDLDVSLCMHQNSKFSRRVWRLEKFVTWIRSADQKYRFCLTSETKMKRCENIFSILPCVSMDQLIWCIGCCADDMWSS